MCGETVWTHDKAKSASATKRAKEFNLMMRNEEIDIIIPNWGGTFNRDTGISRF